VSAQPGDAQSPITIIEGRPLSDENKRLLALRDEIEKNQLEYLDQSAKRIVELVTLLLGVLFTIIAFGDKFPPAYLASQTTKAVLLAVLTLYVVALLLGVVAMAPRKIKRYEHNVSEMRGELESLVSSKLIWFRASAIVFVLATLALAVLIGIIVLGA
jgi:hypothetical protein